MVECMDTKSHTVILYYTIIQRPSAIINKSNVKPDFHEKMVRHGVLLTKKTQGSDLALSDTCRAHVRANQSAS